MNISFLLVEFLFFWVPLKCQRMKKKSNVLVFNCCKGLGQIPYSMSVGGKNEPVLLLFTWTDDGLYLYSEKSSLREELGLGILLKLCFWSSPFGHVFVLTAFISKSMAVLLNVAFTCAGKTMFRVCVPVSVLRVWIVGLCFPVAYSCLSFGRKMRRREIELSVKISSKSTDLSSLLPKFSQVGLWEVDTDFLLAGSPSFRDHAFSCRRLSCVGGVSCWGSGKGSTPFRC